MKLWNNQKFNKKVDKFTVGKDRLYDLNIAKFDCHASIAHASMLKKIGILNTSELKKINNVLNEIIKDIDNKEFNIGEEFEDVHSKIEFLLTEKLGDTGKKIHTSRSRNDQVLAAIQLFILDSLNDIKIDLKELFNILITLAKNHKNKLMPGYSHLQIAMTSSFGLWFSSYAESLIDDLIFLNSAIEVVNQNPLGSAAGFGSTFPIDRIYTTKKLGFKFLKVNSMACQISRGKIEKSTSMALSLIASTISKLSMDICLYMGQDFDFISFPSDLLTGSSIMPHKQNPDIFELIRAKSNLIQNIPNQISLLTTNLPSGYHRDFQLTKGPIIDGINDLKDCLEMFIYSIPQIKIKTKILDQKKYKYINSVEKINHEVLKGKTFRESYLSVSEKIKNNKYKKPKKIKYTHIGSIGNLSLDMIEKKFNYYYNLLK